MNKIARLFYRPALWLPGIICFVALLLNWQLPPLNQRPSSVGAAILSAFVFNIAGLSVSACWDAIRMKQLATTTLRLNQFPKLIGWILLPLLSWSLLSYCITWGFVTWQIQTLTVPDLRTLFLALLLSLAWSLFGIALGWLLPKPLALLGSTSLPFLVTTSAWTVPAYEWRHMFGIPSDCCSINSNLHPSMVLASTLTLLGISVLSVGIILLKRTRFLYSIPLFVLVLVLIPLAFQQAHKVNNFVAATPRDEKDEVCEDLICFWPESTPQQREANRIALAQAQATLPPEWLQTRPLVRANRNVYTGPIDDIQTYFGDAGAPLPFEMPEDHAKVYQRFLVRLLIRYGYDGGRAAALAPSTWQEWVVQREGLPPATPEEIMAFVEQQITTAQQ